MFRTARRTIAGFILGDDAAFYASRADIERMKNSQFLELPDETIGKMFKHFWTTVCRTQDKDEKDKDMSFGAKMRCACVLYLSSEMNRAKANSATYTVKGSIDGGRTEGAWAVHVEADPDYEQREEKQVEVDGKIVSLTVTNDNPGYEEWRQKNAEKLARALDQTAKE